MPRLLLDVDTRDLSPHCRSVAESLGTPPAKQQQSSDSGDSGTATKPMSSGSVSQARVGSTTQSLTSIDKSPSNFSPLAAGVYYMQDEAANTTTPPLQVSISPRSSAGDELEAAELMPASLLQVHFYDQAELVGSDIQSRRLMDCEEDAASFVTAWGPNTPANLADMTPGFWLNAGTTHGPGAGLTPPPFHTGVVCNPTRSQLAATPVVAGVCHLQYSCVKSISQKRPSLSSNFGRLDWGGHSRC